MRHDYGVVMAYYDLAYNTLLNASMIYFNETETDRHTDFLLFLVSFFSLYPTSLLPFSYYTTKELTKVLQREFKGGRERERLKGKRGTRRGKGVEMCNNSCVPCSVCVCVCVCVCFLYKWTCSDFILKLFFLTSLSPDLT